MSLENLKLLTKAYQFAAYKHRNQKRKNGQTPIPYINHPIQCSKILTECGISDVKILCGAILHDTVQDTETTEQEIQTQFGPQIKLYVLQCSDDKNLGKVQRKQNQIQHSLHISKEAKYIKIADKISNNSSLLTQSPKGWSKDRVFGYFIWSEAVFKNLEGDNQLLNQKMKSIFQKAGIYKLSQEERKNQLSKYFTLLNQ